MKKKVKKLYAKHRNSNQLEDKRSKIIEAAKKVFSQHGFNDAKISQISKIAGVADGTIYEYFENKEDLLHSITTEKWKEIKYQVSWHLEGIKGALNKIRKYIWFCLSSFESDPDYAYITLLIQRHSKNFLKTPAYKSTREFTGIILELVKQGKEEGSIEESLDADLIRRMILGSIEHITTRWLLVGKGYSIIQYSEPLGDLIIKGIRKSPRIEDY